ncbi:UNKNOWN [Stylonychia lemnae]|uniref:Uncharacterized protein n=1 Tax=Stylonychia lemnae TaxID=5949 RepID=A0A077ZYH3_STYLE|nr:UNKNOWN [Stylonychia lemnae]|eukprot:CDW74247.1 UNKNOWN [Stylonychia lemnae]
MPTDFFHGHCINATAEKCGLQQSLKVNIEDIPGSIQTSNISVSQKSACAYQFYHRTNGFLRFGGQELDLEIDKLENLEIIVASGSDASTLTQLYNTSDIVVDDWIKFKVTEWIYVAVYPKANSIKNSFHLNYKKEDVLPVRRKYSEQLIANDMQLGITLGGLALFLIILFLIYLKKRNDKRKKQNIGSNSGSLNNSRLEGGHSIKAKDNERQYSKVLDKSKDYDENALSFR